MAAIGVMAPTPAFLPSTRTTRPRIGIRTLGFTPPSAASLTCLFFPTGKNTVSYGDTARFSLPWCLTYSPKPPKSPDLVAYEPQKIGWFFDKKPKINTILGEMSDQKITNEMLYELLKEFKADTQKQFEGVQKQFEGIQRQFEGAQRQFEGIQKQFENTQKQFESINHRLDRLEDNQKRDMDRINEIFYERDKVTVNFTRGWAAASFGIAFTASTMTFLVSKIF